MSKSSEPQNTYESEVGDDWLDRFASFNQHFGRFARDTLGVILIAAALMTLLALRGYTQGLLLTPWANLLLLWFGWGAYLVVLAIGYVGYAFLRRSSTPLPWGRLFALEHQPFDQPLAGRLSSFGQFIPGSGPDNLGKEQVGVVGGRDQLL